MYRGDFCEQNFFILIIIYSNSSFAAFVNWELFGHVKNNTGFKADDLHFDIKVTGGSTSDFDNLSIVNTFKKMKTTQVFDNVNKEFIITMNLSSPAQDILKGEFADISIFFRADELSEINISNIFWTKGRKPIGLSSHQPSDSEIGTSIRRKGLPEPSSFILLCLGIVVINFLRVSKERNNVSVFFSKNHT